MTGYEIRKTKFTLEQAMMAYRGSKCTTVLILLPRHYMGGGAGGQHQARSK